MAKTFVKWARFFSAPCDFLFKCAVYKYTYLLTYFSLRCSCKVGFLTVR